MSVCKKLENNKIYHFTIAFSFELWCRLVCFFTFCIKFSVFFALFAVLLLCLSWNVLLAFSILRLALYVQFFTHSFNVRPKDNCNFKMGLVMFLYIALFCVRRLLARVAFSQLFCLCISLFTAISGVTVTAKSKKCMRCETDFRFISNGYVLLLLTNDYTFHDDGEICSELGSILFVQLLYYFIIACKKTYFSRNNFSNARV